MSSEFSIRAATSSDVTSIKEICRLSFGPIYRYFAIQSLNSEGPVFVGETNGVVVGFVKLVQSQIASRNVGDILWLAVRPAYRRKDFGSTLIAASISYFESQGVHPVYASIGYRNKPALALFQRNGFHKLSFHDLMKSYRRHLLRFYSEFWIAPTEVVLMYSQHTNEMKG